MSTAREPFSRFLERMEQLGFRPSKRLGQNFLLDPSLHKAIADAASLGAEDLVLEVGAGLGFLTRELAARARRVVAVEVDPRLLEILRQELPHFPGGGQNVQLIAGDILAGEQTLHPEVGAALAVGQGPVVVVANLPYAISGPFLAICATLERAPDRIVVLVQKELAERLVARAGDPEYGSLAVLMGCGYEGRLLRKVGPEVFRPRPRVDSALVLLERRQGHRFWGLAAESRSGFARFVRMLFTGRRKMLRRALPMAWSLLGHTGPPLVPQELASARPEQLAPQQCLDLWLGQSPGF